MFNKFYPSFNKYYFRFISNVDKLRLSLIPLGRQFYNLQEEIVKDSLRIEVL